MNSRKVTMIAHNAVISAIMIVLISFNPVGFGPIQVRPAEVFSVIPFYNKDYTSGVLIGMFIGNMFSPMGLVDAVAGVAVGVIAYTLATRFKPMLVKNLIFSITSGIIIGFMLLKMMEVPFMVSFIGVTISTMVSTSLGTWVMERHLKQHLMS